MIDAIISVISVVFMPWRHHRALGRSDHRTGAGTPILIDSSGGVEYLASLPEARLFHQEDCAVAVRVVDVAGRGVRVGERAQGRLQCSLRIVRTHRAVGGLPGALRVYL